MKTKTKVAVFVLFCLFFPSTECQADYYEYEKSLALDDLRQSIRFLTVCRAGIELKLFNISNKEEQEKAEGAILKINEIIFRLEHHIGVILITPADKIEKWQEEKKEAFSYLLKELAELSCFLVFL